MAKKKAAAKKKTTAKTAKKAASTKTARPAAKKKASKAAGKKTASKKAAKKAVKKKKATPKPAAESRPAKKKAVAAKKVVKKAARPARKKGVRRATLVAPVSTESEGNKMGRSRIPTDAPLAVVFQNDLQAQEAFNLLGITTIRELEEMDPDELVRLLTRPAKHTVGRIRRTLAMNNRCLLSDEAFAVDYQERLANDPNVRVTAK
ncbi:MAG: hypothetical protein ABJZ55_12935 [Fuerstiella sp.]